MRRDLHELLKMLAPLKGLDDLTLTTNGLLLPQKVDGLKAAGLKRVNISFDAVDESTYKALSGGRGNSEKVIEAINCSS